MSLRRARNKRYLIATQHGYVNDDFDTKAAAKKELAKLARESAAACRRSHRTCSIIGSARKGSVQIKIGGRQGYHLWQRFVVTER